MIMSVFLHRLFTVYTILQFLIELIILPINKKFKVFVTGPLDVCLFLYCLCPEKYDQSSMSRVVGRGEVCRSGFSQRGIFFAEMPRRDEPYTRGNSNGEGVAISRGGGENP